jgi:hypothetical protein
MANWKEASDCCTGSCVKYGAPDVKKISQLYNNVNVNVACLGCNTQIIHEGNIFTFQGTPSGCCAGLTAFGFQGSNDACCAQFTYTIHTSAITADRKLTIPLAIQDETFTVNGLAQSIFKKTAILDGCCANILTQTTPADGATLQCSGTSFVARDAREWHRIEVFGRCDCVTTGCAKTYIDLPHNIKLTDIYATVGTASTCGVPSIQVQQTCIDILSTAITIDQCEVSSKTACVPPVISDCTLDVDARLSVDVDVAGTGTKGLWLYIAGYHRFV